MKSNRLRLCGAILGIVLTSAPAWADDRICPDGQRAYFGVCPGDATPAGPTTAPQDPFQSPENDSLKAGYYLQKNDIADALPLLQRAAEGGDTWSLVTLGKLYDLGRGVPQDYERAAALYQRAADQGDSDAELLLALLYAAGNGVAQNGAKALDLLEKSAAQNNPGALTALAITHKTIFDDMFAVDYLQRAVKQDYAPAQVELALMYEDGRGVPKSHKEAVRLMRKAAAHGESRASDWLGSNK